jgi:hypothetical protein
MGGSYADTRVDKAHVEGNLMTAPTCHAPPSGAGAIPEAARYADRTSIGSEPIGGAAHRVRSATRRR